jgi:hypothetical protein
LCQAFLLFVVLFNHDLTPIIDIDAGLGGLVGQATAAQRIPHVLTGAVCRTLGIDIADACRLLLIDVLVDEAIFSPSDTFFLAVTEKKRIFAV